MFLINTLLGFAIAQVYDVLIRRKKYSDASPQKFDILFFWRDTRQKIIVSLILSFLISIFIKINDVDIATLINSDWNGFNNALYGLIGFCPELVLQWLKRKYGFLQPDIVDGYVRK